MSYDQVISDAVKVVEAIGAGIMVGGGIAAFARFGLALKKRASSEAAYLLLRRELGRAILLGLEVLIVGDIVRTIIVETTFESVAVLGLIVVIRIVLSFALEVEIDGTWPWSRWRLDQQDGGAAPPGG